MFRAASQGATIAAASAAFQRSSVQACEMCNWRIQSYLLFILGLVFFVTGIYLMYEASSGLADAILALAVSGNASAEELRDALDTSALRENLSSYRMNLAFGSISVATFLFAFGFAVHSARASSEQSGQLLQLTESIVRGELKKTEKSIVAKTRRVRQRGKKNRKR